MWLLHGKPIISEQVENIISRNFSPNYFASLCNAISWASAGRKCSSLPSFTERHNVKDGGIDVEWNEEFPDDHNYFSPLLGPGWNIFQYKQRDIFTQGRDKVFSNLKTGLKGALKDIYKRTNRRPNRYVLFTNLDLTHFTKAENAANPQKGELKKSILYNYDQPGKVQIKIVAAGELSAFLNNEPHLRSAYFTPNSFLIWQEYYHRFCKQKENVFGSLIEVIGRDKELLTLHSMIDDDNIRAIVLSGPNCIGKTRVAIEATKHHPIETIIALDPLSMTVSDLLDLESPNKEIIVIIEDPEPEKIRMFMDQALATSGLKLLITCTLLEKALTPNLGRDERIQFIRLEPLSETKAHKLLRTANAMFDCSMNSWVIEQAGGNPGILLLAARNGPELRKTSEIFLDDVAQAFKQKIQRELGIDSVKILQLLSLLTSVGIKGKQFNEIELICSVFGEGIQPNNVLNELPRLRNAGVVKEKGNYVEITPLIFANNLAASALKGNYTELYTLCGTLNRYARFRLFRRLTALIGNEVDQFWSELFGLNGLFKDLKSSLENGYLLRLVAGTLPEHVTQLIKKDLTHMSLEDRLRIDGDERRDLIWTIEELLFMERTSETALHLMALLAEAENEDYGNNATGVFCECFSPVHPQFPLSLKKRFDLLVKILSPENSTGFRIIAVKAIKSTISQLRVFRLRQSSGPEPLDARPTTTHGEVWNYIEDLTDLLMKTTQSEDQELAEYALEDLPKKIAESAILARPQKAVEHFQTLVDLVLAHKFPISVAELSESINRNIDFFSHILSGDIDEDKAIVYKNCSGDLEALIKQLENGDFSIKLERWTGKWTRDDRKYKLDGTDKRVYRYVKELEDLAKKVVKRPRVLTNELITWLCSDKAKKAHTFFQLLGKIDTERRFLNTIEEIGGNKNGAIAFSSYCLGLSQIDSKFVKNWLDKLTKDKRVTAETIVRATGNLKGNLRGIERIEILVKEQRIDPITVKQILCWGGWLETLFQNEFLRFLKVIANKGLRNATDLIDLLEIWLSYNHNIDDELAEFAWQCLETAPHVKPHQVYSFDQLALRLSQYDIERAFKLLEKLLSQQIESKFWNPIIRYDAHEFWNFLCERDCKRALRITFLVASNNPLKRFEVTWNLSGIINQVKFCNELIEFSYEDECKAKFICNCITVGREGFWDIALKIIDKYPNSQEIQDALTRAVRLVGQTFWGSYAMHLKNFQNDVERILKEDSTPMNAIPWLKKLSSSLLIQSEKELISESNEDVNDLIRIFDNPAAPERLWAIETLIKRNRLDKLKNYISKDNIMSLLSKLNLPTGEKKKIQKKIEDWS